MLATPLDDFLAGTESDTGERLRQIGAGLGLFGTVLSVGVLVFLATVHRGRRSEISTLLRLAGAAGVMMLIGAIVELIGVADEFEVGWSDTVTLDAGSAAMLRMLAGLLVVLGLFEHTIPLRAAADEPGADETAADETADDGPHRWLPSPASAFGMVGVALGAFSFAFDGHTVSEGPRALHAFANVVHVSAAGTWFGGLVALVAVAVHRQRAGDDDPIGLLVVRFSSVATVALTVAAAAGVAMSLMIADGLDGYIDTEWGRRLIVKLVAVAVAAGLGAYNHIALVPRLAIDLADPDLARRARTTLVVEAMVLAFVGLATVSLVHGSTV